MKDTDLLYSAATLAIGSILAIFICYATGTLPQGTPTERGPVTVKTPREKNCGCCAKMTPEKLAERREENRLLRKRRQRYENATKLFEQYGIEEGLLRLKQVDPETAATLETFMDTQTRTRQADPDRWALGAPAAVRLDTDTRQ